MKRVIVSADDFGLSEAVNEGIERAHREGILSTASLMVAGKAAADAVRRAKRMPGLRVGLHLVAIEGPAMLGPPIGSDQLRLGLRYFFNPLGRRALAAEIRAQFRAFAASGLALDHANAHKHMHVHPTVGGLLIRIGREFGLRALRVPAEPPAVLEACGTATGFGDRALYRFTGLLRARARQAGLRVNDHVFGIAWSGHMTRERILRLASNLPEGLSEIYFHPAASRDATIDALMPDYAHEDECACLCDAAVARALQANATLVGWP